jgi:lysozyme
LKDDPGELPPVADFEAPRLGSLYPSNALLEQFLEEVETKLNRKPMIYTSPGYWSTHGRNKVTKQYDQKWAYFPLWVAHYMKSYQAGVSKPDELEPWKSTGKKWTFWQYTSTGDGLAYGAESKGIDLNWFNGTMTDLNNFAYGSSTAPSTPPTTTPSGKPLDITGLKNSINKTIDDWAKTQ